MKSSFAFNAVQRLFDDNVVVEYYVGQGLSVKSINFAGKTSRLWKWAYFQHRPDMRLHELNLVPVYVQNAGFMSVAEIRSGDSLIGADNLAGFPQPESSLVDTLRFKQYKTYRKRS